MRDKVLVFVEILDCLDERFVLQAVQTRLGIERFNRRVARLDLTLGFLNLPDVAT